MWNKKVSFLIKVPGNRETRWWSPYCREVSVKYKNMVITSVSVNIPAKIHLVCVEVFCCCCFFHKKTYICWSSPWSIWCFFWKYTDWLIPLSIRKFHQLTNQAICCAQGPGESELWCTNTTLGFNNGPPPTPINTHTQTLTTKWHLVHWV